MVEGYTIFLVTPRGQKRQLFFSRTRMRVFLSIGIALVLLILGGLLFYGPIYLRALQTRALLRENQTLRVDNAKIHELRKQLNELQAYREQLSNMLGIEHTPPPAQLDTQQSTLFASSEQVHNPATSFSPPMRELYKRAHEEERFTPRGKPMSGFVSRDFSVKHTAIDIVAPLRTPIRTAADGLVREVDVDSTLGHRVLLEHGERYRTLYGHLDRVIVHTGQRLTRGDLVGYSGNSGKSTGPHLHYEIWKKGRPVDPSLYFED